MKFSNVVAATACAVLMTACNSGNNDGAAAMTYDFIVPATNSQRSYEQTIVDNSDNVIKETFSDTVTSVNTDNAYVVLQEDTTGMSVVVDGTTYSIPTETINVDAQGHDTSYSYTDASGTLETCTFSPYGPGPAYPVTVGGSWTTDYTVTCGTAAPISHTQTGAVVDVETVTVPAGTFTAVKLQSTDVWTNADGTTITETAFTWRDVDTTFSVQRTITRAYSGTLPTKGYEVTAQIVLKSIN
jgi:hypothetical protein